MEIPELAQGGALGVLLIIVWKLLDALLASRSNRNNGAREDIRLMRVVTAIEKVGDKISTEIKELRRAIYELRKDK